MKHPQPKRHIDLNQEVYKNGPVLYWMNRDCRVDDNFALLFAQEKALELDTPLIVLYNLVPGFLGGTLRSHHFKIEGLKEVEENLKKKNIPFFLIEGDDTEKEIVKFIEQKNIGYLVTDFSPLKTSIKWERYIKSHISIPFVVLDTHNIVPCFFASQKLEYGAYTLRPKLHKLLPLFLQEIPKLKTQTKKVSHQKPIDWQKVLHNKKLKLVPPAKWITGGEKAGLKMLRSFLKEKLDTYGTDRNDPTKDGQSNLSPYLHFGHISPQRVVLEALKYTQRTIETVLNIQKNGAKEEAGSLEAFIEELVVRRELADNFCFYNPHYDTFEGFPAWAQKTLNEAREDKRDYVYSKKQFEEALTHDELWNAAQNQMVTTGKMHGYMRMYWAKKILEWSKSPEDALEIAIYLNDTYELDGRDPNGYAGIAWSIGGVHDRAWFPRKVFGLVRFMARSGVEKKCDVKKYIEMYS